MREARIGQHLLQGVVRHQLEIMSKMPHPIRQGRGLHASHVHRLHAPVLLGVPWGIRRLFRMDSSRQLQPRTSAGTFPTGRTCLVHAAASVEDARRAAQPNSSNTLSGSCVDARWEHTKRRRYATGFCSSSAQNAAANSNPVFTTTCLITGHHDLASMHTMRAVELITDPASDMQDRRALEPKCRSLS